MQYLQYFVSFLILTSMHVLNWLSNIFPFQRPGCGNDVSYTVSIIRFKLFSGYRFSLIFLFNISSSSANSIWSWRRFSEQLTAKEELKDKIECELKRILLTSSCVSSKQIPEDLRWLCRSWWISGSSPTPWYTGTRCLARARTPRTGPTHTAQLPSPRQELTSSPKHDLRPGLWTSSAPSPWGFPASASQGGDNAACMNSFSSAPLPSPDSAQLRYHSSPHKSLV